MLDSVQSVDIAKVKFEYLGALASLHCVDAFFAQIQSHRRFKCCLFVSALSRTDRWLRGSGELVAHMLSSFPLPWWPHNVKREFSFDAIWSEQASTRKLVLSVHLVTCFKMRQRLTSTQLLAYCTVHSLAFLMASSSFDFQCSAIASSRGSSQFGAERSAWIESRT